MSQRSSGCCLAALTSSPKINFTRRGCRTREEETQFISSLFVKLQGQNMSGSNSVMILFVLVTILGVIESHDSSTCVVLRSVYESTCPGQDGRASHPELHNHIRNVTKALNRRISKLEERNEFCWRRYDNKCFWIEIRFDTPRISFNEARQLCANHGGTPANIYSKDHYYMMLEYLRTFATPADYMHAWLGMTYNRARGYVYLSDGATRASYLKWLPNHPMPTSDVCCNIGMDARTNPESTAQNLFTGPPDWQLRAVLCER